MRTYRTLINAAHRAVLPATVRISCLYFRSNPGNVTDRKL